MDIDLSAVFGYYNDCWDNRFLNGHNSISHACHYGFYSEPDKNNLNNTQSEYDKGKKQLNNKLIVFNISVVCAPWFWIIRWSEDQVFLVNLQSQTIRPSLSAYPI